MSQMAAHDFEGSQVFDGNPIDELDPSLVDGFHVIYDREVPMEIRHHYAGDESISTGTLEAIKVKVLLLGSDENPSSIRLELSSESDLFFHYIHMIDDQDFQTIQEQQKLVVDYGEYPNVLIRMLNSCIREPHTHLAIFIVRGEEEARLDFIQNMEYKFIELVSCNCQRSSEEMIQKQITYRYNAMKQKLAVMQSRLHEINNLVKMKNPSLLLQLQKSSVNMSRR
ncbi:SASS6 [Symbiodinium microadriaticum]|nr:SASS6 [Symbiodinium microadriaticum]